MLILKHTVSKKPPIDSENVATVRPYRATFYIVLVFLVVSYSTTDSLLFILVYGSSGYSCSIEV
jgi:hypothetical protein